MIFKIFDDFWSAWNLALYVRLKQNNALQKSTKIIKNHKHPEKNNEKNAIFKNGLPPEAAPKGDLGF